jgi:hypothetical protein
MRNETSATRPPAGQIIDAFGPGPASAGPATASRASGYGAPSAAAGLAPAAEAPLDAEAT